MSPETRQVEADPFYFGSAAEPLFGLHYPPTSGPAREAGIVLCYPIGHEYIVAHRAYRQLSIRLAAAGFHVLRFDYHATGDSAGDCERGAPPRWLADISTAIGELRRRSACGAVTLVGCRLGATLAALVGAERGDVERMVLWDPVVNGKDHVGEISQRHQDMLRRTQVVSRLGADRAGERELLGFAMTDTALDEIEALDLMAMSRGPATNLLVVNSQAGDATAPWRAHVARAGTIVTYDPIPVPRAWTWIEDPATILVPNQILGAIVAWLAQVRS